MNEYAWICEIDHFHDMPGRKRAPKSFSWTFECRDNRQLHVGSRCHDRSSRCRDGRVRSGTEIRRSSREDLAQTDTWFTDCFVGSADTGWAYEHTTFTNEVGFVLSRIDSCTEARASSCRIRFAGPSGRASLACPSCSVVLRPTLTSIAFVKDDAPQSKHRQEYICFLQLCTRQCLLPSIATWYSYC